MILFLKLKYILIASVFIFRQNLKFHQFCGLRSTIRTLSSIIFCGVRSTIGSANKRVSSSLPLTGLLSFDNIHFNRLSISINFVDYDPLFMLNVVEYQKAKTVQRSFKIFKQVQLNFFFLIPLDLFY